MIRAYLWYSGILFQCLFVLVGLQAALGFLSQRPPLTLEKNVSSKIRDLSRCSSLFAGQEFSWLRPQPVVLDIRTSGAEVVRFAYRNEGTTAITENGHHIYRVWFELDVRDKKAGRIVRFPPRTEHHFEVDEKNRIVACVPACSLRTRGSKGCVSTSSSKRLRADSIFICKSAAPFSTPLRWFLSFAS